jgi:hypothetical protein
LLPPTMIPCYQYDQYEHFLSLNVLPFSSSFRLSTCMP